MTTTSSLLSSGAGAAIQFVVCIEGYEYLGILTTLDPKRATCQINSTADTRDIVIDVLTHLTDVVVKILGSREEAVKK